MGLRREWRLHVRAGVGPGGARAPRVHGSAAAAAAAQWGRSAFVAHLLAAGVAAAVGMLGAAAAPPPLVPLGVPAQDGSIKGLQPQRGPPNKRCVNHAHAEDEWHLGALTIGAL